MHQSDDTNALRSRYEAELTEPLDRELTDDQLVQLAEGSCSWGANCNEPCDVQGCDDLARRRR